MKRHRYGLHSLVFAHFLNFYEVDQFLDICLYHIKADQLVELFHAAFFHLDLALLCIVGLVVVYEFETLFIFLACADYIVFDGTHYPSLRDVDAELLA